MQIRSGDQIEVTLKRMCREVPGIFKSHCLELFVPVAADQDLDAIELTTIDTVFSRSDHFPTLLRCKQVTGIAGLLTMGDSGRSADSIPVADPYVQSLITDAAAVFLQRGMGIVVGSFVRILNSEYRGYCGYVTSIDGTMGIVQIEYLDR